MTKYENIAIASSAVIAVVGFIYGIKTEGANFARAGALITVVGIIYGLLDLPSRLANVESWARKERNKLRGQLKKSAMESGKNEIEAESIVQSSIEEAVQEINIEATKKRRELIFVEGAILVSGTMIWGFGDLINLVCCCQG